MVNVGDKVMFVEKFEVCGMQMNKTIFTIREIRKNQAMIVSDLGVAGVMSLDEIGKTFIKVRNWSEWRHTGLGFRYRTDNERYVDVFYNGKVKRASCHPMDKFDVTIGLMVCMSKFTKGI